MTIPSRPAPAPPGSRGQCAAAGANASLEQLRLQLQQQHMQQQQAAGGGLQKLTIKLPPPPKGPLQSQNLQHKRNVTHNNNNNNNGSLFDEPIGGSSITRKFPQARYTPATNWDDDPFGGNGNDRFKKMPPPRPPPPKVLVNGQNMAKSSSSTASAAAGGSKLISNIFHRKKSTSTASAAATKAAAENRVYGLSSGNAGTPNYSSTSSASSAAFNVDWNAAWNTATTTTSSSSHSSHYACQQMADTQLISFDSPPSSPTFTQKSNSDCVSVDSFSSDSNFSSPNNGSVSQPESGFEDDYHRSRPSTQSPLDPWEAVDSINHGGVDTFGSAPVRQTYQLQARSSDNPLCNGKSLLPPTQSLTMPTIIKPKISQKPKAPKPPPFIGGIPPGYSIPVLHEGSETPPSPPMPKGPPPPLPNGGISLLDVISGKVDALALSNGCQGYMEEEVVPYAIALYDFDGVEEGDLNFRESEKIYLLDHPTPEWMRGRTRSGCEGIFPINYVDIKVPLGATGGGAAGPATRAAAPSTSPPQQLANTALCLYHFPGEVEGDLPLQENELVTVLYRINEDWLYGEIAGRQGQFPANFLDQVPANLPTL
ncbi:actin cytoskeleton-regulatory complex protein pan1 [Drosophila eugracilis]|uniref:actin cytoskeleton-regulatory complex protein pan1 n=1 Tax=Drosophila eugracilis TaxID=29029 RepID=UPI0007E601A7|nr:actin cytoskeleton-regulatory complex protein pan1 [Drosophila eugracilis]